MSHQSRSSRSRGLFDAALQDYEKTTSITLAEHPIAEKFQNCHSVEPIITVLQDQAREFCDFPGSDRIMKSIENTASILTMLAATDALGDAIDIVRHKSFMGISTSDACCAVIPTSESRTNCPLHPTCCMRLFLFSRSYSSHIEVHQAGKGVSNSYDELADLFESIEHLLKPLDIYAHIPPTPVMDEMMVKIMVELLSILALTTKELKEGRQSESVLGDMLFH